MAETKASNGVSGNNKKRVSAAVEEVPMDEINQHVVKFTGGNELYVDYVGFEPTAERITTQEEGSGSGAEGTAAAKPAKAGDFTRVDGSGSKPLSDVLKACVILKAKKTKTKTKDVEKEEEPNIDDAQK